MSPTRSRSGGMSIGKTDRRKNRSSRNCLAATAVFRFRLVANGEVMLTSEAYAYEDVAIAGIWAVREAAVTGGIVDLTDTPPVSPASAGSPH